MFDELGWTSERETPPHRTGVIAADPLLAVLPEGDSMDLGQISVKSGLSVPELLPRLMALELRGTVRREPGGRFVRFDRTC
ncbi:MAG: hypothetical protein QM736_19040 [Vicinamibacterales bacterium]